MNYGDYRIVYMTNSRKESTVQLSEMQIKINLCFVFTVHNTCCIFPDFVDLITFFVGPNSAYPCKLSMIML